MKHKPRQRKVAAVVVENVVNVIVVVIVATKRSMPFQGSFDFLNFRH